MSQASLIWFILCCWLGPRGTQSQRAQHTTACPSAEQAAVWVLVLTARERPLETREVCGDRKRLRAPHRQLSSTWGLSHTRVGSPARGRELGLQPSGNGCTPLLRGGDSPQAPPALGGSFPAAWGTLTQATPAARASPPGLEPF